ncbi:MAG TPA: class I SAM-dependent methyltransferase [Acidimicrobiia bacterium]|nr:class I SAM-dependent methyltransferase [Acidimicrobiia bacterium]
MTAGHVFYGLEAEYWDLFRSSDMAWDDREFFHELIGRHGEPVLDVGCGTGRLLFDFLEHGWDVDGIDVSPAMLDICEQKADELGLAIDVYEQAMEDLDLPREFGTIIVSSSAFQLIIEPERARAAMSRFKEHLRPGGVLAMPISSPAKPATSTQLDGPAEWTSVTEAARSDGAVVRRSSKFRFDPGTRIEHREDVFDVIENGTVTTSERHDMTPTVRYYDRAEVIELFRNAGFGHLELLDPETVKPIDGDVPLYVAVGQNV